MIIGEKFSIIQFSILDLQIYGNDNSKNSE